MQNEAKDQEAFKEICQQAANHGCRLSLHALFFGYTKNAVPLASPLFLEMLHYNAPYSIIKYPYSYLNQIRR